MIEVMANSGDPVLLGTQHDVALSAWQTSWANLRNDTAPIDVFEAWWSAVGVKPHASIRTLMMAAWDAAAIAARKVGRQLIGRQPFAMWWGSILASQPSTP